MKPLRLTLFGAFSLHDEEGEVELPASRKTRALLAYLALNSRAHRRERLCDMFWERTDDPRAALRWSLSKLRPLLNDDRSERLLAERSSVRMADGAFTSERDALAHGAPTEGAAANDLIAALDDEPLAGLDLPDCETYQAWLVAARSELSELRERFTVTSPMSGKPAPEDAPHHPQTIRFCIAPDGTRLAYAFSGEGSPIVKTANWLTHLELDWTSPIDSGQLRALSRQHRLIRYDGRANGLSDWDVQRLSFEDMVSDLETVVEAAGVERFALFGFSQGGAVAIEYAARHPQRVSHLVLHGAFAAGWQIAGSADDIAEREAVKTLLATQWGSDNPSFRHLISSNFLPAAGPEEIDWFSNFQRQTTSARNVADFMDVFGQIDVRARLSEVGAPTLVAHSRGDQITSIDAARELAAQIPDTEFLTLESDNHSLIDREPATELFIERALAFINA